ncbi:MAG TPA: DsbA family protein, partial [Pseudomonadales bacterium]|nr:DsbA family protein [Pseudomonadales bacterium]
LDAGRLVPYARAVFQRYWGELADISQPQIIADIARATGFDADDFLRRIDEPAIRERLRRNTDELIERGGYGTPTMFVNGSDMYFGNDRLVLVDAALSRA